MAVDYMKRHSRIKHSGLADEDGEWFCARWDVFESARQENPSPAIKEIRN
jgi:hypothetical protein